MSTFDATAFRANFPEFADETDYPPAMITFWSGLAVKRLNEERWGDMLEEGWQLLTAHYISIAKQNAEEGIVPGSVGGLLASESAGPVSYSRDTHATIIEGGGDYNLTTYGTMFLGLARIVGSGGYQCT